VKRDVWHFIAAALAILVMYVGTATPVNTVPNAPVAVTADTSSREVAAVAPSVCPNPYEALVPDYKVEERSALRYMRSPERIAKYEADFRQAGVLIAKSLDSGKFAPVTKRYDDWKNDRKPGYSGWGGISTLDNNYYAWVWWNHNGSIAYTKMGVTGFSLTGGGTHLQIEKLDDGDGPYKVFLNDGSGITRISNTYFVGNSRVENFQYARNLSELMELDEDAWAALDYTMTLNFGVNWRQHR
jgi:hypothetical protein